MPKKRRKWIIVLAVLAALSAIGVTLGFMFKKNKRCQHLYSRAGFLHRARNAGRCGGYRLVRLGQ